MQDQKELLSQFKYHTYYAMSYGFERMYRQYFKYMTWFRYERNFEAPLNPFMLHSINPDLVEYRPKTKIGSKFECSVRGGTWDVDLEQFINNTAYSSFKKRFKERADWQETERYHLAINKIKKQGEWKGCQSEEDVLERLRFYDDMFEYMTDEGYKTQRELEYQQQNKGSLHNTLYRPPEFEEITVDIGRDGMFIWHSGIHRLSMAMVAGIESVPVRIRVRHTEWQKTRDEVWNDTKKDASWHPDLIQPQ